jgi:hypothetical protein
MGVIRVDGEIGDDRRVVRRIRAETIGEVVGQPAVQANLLGRKQLVVRGLPQERVAEREGRPVGWVGRQEDQRLGRPAQGRVQLRLVQVHDGRESVQRDSNADDRRSTHHGQGVLR